MGDRANIVIEKDGDCFTAPLFLYTHWNGYERKTILRNALNRGRGRWDDPAYLARIIFSEMIQGSVLEETGFGISNVIQDNSYPLLCVNIPAKTVCEREESDYATGEIVAGPWSFDEFITQKDKDEDAE